jgi:hypothetical protein
MIALQSDSMVVMIPLMNAIVTATKSILTWSVKSKLQA